MTIDSVGGRAAINHNKRMVKSLGYTWDEVIFPVTTTDFTPFAQAVADKKPDIVVGHYGSGQNLGVIPALRRSGYNGAYVVASYGVTEDTIRQAAQRAGGGDNIYYVSRYASVSTTSRPSPKWPRAQKKYGTSKPFSSMHITGWALGKFAEDALKGCGWPCTREKLDQHHSEIEGRRRRPHGRSDRNVGRQWLWADVLEALRLERKGQEDGAQGRLGEEHHAQVSAPMTVSGGGHKPLPA